MRSDDFPGNLFRLYVVTGLPRGSARALKRFTAGRSLGRCKVITNDSGAKSELLEENFDASVLADYVRIDSKEELEVYRSAYRIGDVFASAFADILYRGVPIFEGLKDHIIGNMIFLKKLEIILSGLHDEAIDTVILALPHYNHEYLCIADYAADLGHCRKGCSLLTCRPEGTLSRMKESPDRIVGRLTGWRAWAIQGLSGLHRQYSYETLVALSYPPCAGREVRSVFFLQTNEYDLYLKPVYPVIEEFRNAGVGFLVLTDDARVAERFKERNVPFVFTRDQWHGTLSSSQLQHQRKHALRKLFERLGELIRAGRPTWGAESNLLPYLWHTAFYRQAERCTTLVDTAMDVLLSVRPRSLFIMPDSSSSGALVCAVAKRLGLPTVTTLAASVDPSLRSMGVYHADVIAVHGEEMAQPFRVMGYDQKRLIITGNTVLDHAARATSDDDWRYINDTLGLRGGRRLLLIATSRSDPNETQWIERFIEVSSRREDLDVVVKVHPLYTLDDYQQLEAGCRGMRFHLVRDIDLHPLLRTADVVVTDYSHVGKEAVAFGKPLITVNLTGKPYPANRFDEEGVALGITSLDEIEDAIARITSDTALLTSLAQARRRVVERFNYRNDGKAAARLFALLMNPPRINDVTRNEGKENSTQ